MGMGPPGGHWIAKGANRNVEQPISPVISSELSVFCRKRHGKLFLCALNAETSSIGTRWCESTGQATFIQKLCPLAPWSVKGMTEGGERGTGDFCYRIS